MIIVDYRTMVYNDNTDADDNHNTSSNNNNNNKPWPSDIGRVFGTHRFEEPVSKMTLRPM